MVEVAARNWGAVFVSDVIKAAPVYAGLVYSAFALAMAVGRFIGRPAGRPLRAGPRRPDFAASSPSPG